MSLIEASAPGRFGLVGNPSDMYSGSVLSCSITERAYCNIETSVSSITLSLGGEQQAVRSASDLALTGGSLDLLKAAILSLELDVSALPPFALNVNSDIPRQSGLAGSTALFAAVIGVLLEHSGNPQHPYSIAEIVRAAEFGILGTLCGFQDAYMSVFGGLQFMDFRDKIVASNDPHLSPYGTMESLQDIVGYELPVVVAYTGLMHHSGATHKSLYENYCAGDADAIAAAAEFARYARQAKRALLAGDWAQLAIWMNKNQALIRVVQPQNPANERLIDAALGAGALAAKLAGAGGGGSIVALAPGPTLGPVSAALSNAGAAAILHPKPSPGLTVRRVD